MEEDQEPAPLSYLRQDQAPSPELRGRVVDSLEARGALRRATRARWGWAIAAGITLFAAGMGLGRWSLTKAPESQRYALLLYDPAGFDRSIPEENLVEEYREWAISLGDRLSMGEKLSIDERLLREDDSENRPNSVEGAAGPLGGLFIVRAGTWEEAMAIARSCPHLKHGGVVAVREIVPT
jgi:hypothetical protein